MKKYPGQQCAKAGIQDGGKTCNPWIPAFAGMTEGLICGDAGGGAGMLEGLICGNAGSGFRDYAPLRSEWRWASRSPSKSKSGAMLRLQSTAISKASHEKPCL
jgi:hypothetical protein